MAKLTEQMAKDMMDLGFHCSQVVADHIAERFDLDKGAWLRLTAGLGGGCCHGDTCGAISAAILGLGVAYGYDEANPGEKDVFLKEKVKELQERFIEKNGSVLCRDLLNGYDNADPNRVSKPDTWDKCPMFCADAAELMDELID